MLLLLKPENKKESRKFAKENGFLPELELCRYMNKYTLLPTNPKKLNTKIKEINSLYPIVDTSAKYIVFKRKITMDCAIYEQEFKKTRL